nr:MAG TPA: Putative heavy-metal-binding protein [Caudoviricetes sp.]
MKKVLSILAGMFLFASCATYQPTPKSFVSMIDYSAFTQQGIYVTESNSVNFDYEAIGSICAEELGGWISKKSSEYSDPKEEYYLGSSFSKKIYVKPDIQEAFKKLMDKLSQSGANGLINMRIEFTKELDIVGKQVTVDKIIVSGMAIKR